MSFCSYTKFTYVWVHESTPICMLPVPIMMRAEHDANRHHSVLNLAPKCPCRSMPILIVFLKQNTHRAYIYLYESQHTDSQIHVCKSSPSIEMQILLFVFLVFSNFALFCRITLLTVQNKAFIFAKSTMPYTFTSNSITKRKKNIKRRAFLSSSFFVGHRLLDDETLTHNMREGLSETYTLLTWSTKIRAEGERWMG